MVSSGYEAGTRCYCDIVTHLKLATTDHANERRYPLITHMVGSLLCETLFWPQDYGRQVEAPAS